MVVAVVTQGAETRDGVAEAARRMAAIMSERGRSAGWSVRVEAYDDPCERAGSASLAGRIAESGAAVIVGHACSISAAVGAPLYAAAGKTLIVAGHGGGGKAVAGALYLPAVGETQGQYLGRQASRIAAPDARIALVSDRTRWALTNVREAGAVLQSAGRAPVVTETFAGGDKDFAGLSARLAAAGITHVVLAAFGSEAGLFVADLVRALPDIVVVGTETLAGPEFQRAAGAAAANVLVAMKPDVETAKAGSEAARQMLDGFEREKVRPTRTMIATAAAIELIATAFKHEAFDATVTAQAIGEALRTAVPASTALGPVAFGPDGQATVSAWRLHRWSGGRLTVVQP